MVIGHISEQEGILGIHIKEQLLNLCLNHNISVYTYDNESVAQFKDLFNKQGLFYILQLRCLFMQTTHSANYIW